MADRGGVRMVLMARWYWNATCLILLLTADNWLNALSTVVIWVVPFAIARLEASRAE